MDKLDQNIFGDKKFSDLLQEIYENQKKKEKQISTLIKELQPLVENIGDATLIVPLIAEYLDIGVRNDDMLIKMANIVQKFLSAKSESGSDSLTISQEEKDQLLSDIKKLKENP